MSNPSLYDLSAKRIDGENVSLDKFRGQVLLIVNVASHCGFTKQYAGLEDLYRKYQSRGFSILGFPCSQFMNQEFADDSEISQFCSRKFDVTFPLFSKVDVNGKNAHAVFQFLKESRPGILGLQQIKWNFTKFLVDRKGNVTGRYSPTTTPAQLEDAIVKLLDEK